MAKTVSFMGLAVTLLLVTLSCGGGGGGSSPQPPASGSLVTGFGSGGVILSNPTSSSNVPGSAVIDGTALYVVGTDQIGTGDYQLRIEKRSLTDGSLVAGFGVGGVVTSNPGSGDDGANAVVTDGTALYIGGYDSTPGNNQWRIEKRSLTNGALVTTFGASGVVTNDPSTNTDVITCMAIDSTFLYVVGFDGTNGSSDLQWRIEKRRLDTGELVSAFDGDGVVTSNITGGYERPNAVVADGNALYIAGVDPTGNDRGRIEKRDLASGSLVTAFGTNGILPFDPSVNRDNILDLAIDANALYLVGYDESPAVNDSQWRIEKRSLTDGSVVWSKVSNPSTYFDSPVAYRLDGGYLYIAGTDYSAGASDSQWRIEKRNASDGELVAAFGTDGVVTANPSSHYDAPAAIVADGDSIYIAGYDASPGAGDSEWRIEKRVK